MKALRLSSLAFLALILTSSSGCALLSELLSGVVTRPTMTFQGAQLQALSFEGLQLELNWRVDNPNDLGVKLATIGYGLEIDGHRFAEGVAPEGITLEPQGSSKVSLPLKVQYKELGQALSALFQKQQLPWKVHGSFGFETPAGIIELPFQREGVLPVPRLPSVKIAGAKVIGLSLTGASLQLDLDLQNGNSFALPGSRLDYQLGVAGQQVATGSATPAAVASGQTGRISLPMQISFLGSSRAIYEAIRAGEVDLSLDGKLGLGPLTRPLHLARRVRLSR